jgi:phosphatidylglycerol:prolipoprotein diacylglycerol transferase
VRPVLIHLPLGLPLYAYGAMLCVSVVAGRLLALRLAERDGMDASLMNRCAVWGLAGAIIGARLLFVVTNLDQIDHIFDIFTIWNGGLVAYGGFLGGFVGMIIFCRMHRLAFLPWADCVAPSLCLGLTITRIGCFLGGCDYGKPWDGAWAVRFPAGSPAFVEQTLQGLLPPGATQSLAVHPTQLYESLAGVVLLALFIAVRRRRGYPGQAFLAIVVGYAVLRSAIEVLRADLGRGAVGPLSTSQFIGIATIVATAALSYVLRRRSSQMASGSDTRLSSEEDAACAHF